MIKFFFIFYLDTVTKEQESSKPNPHPGAKISEYQSHSSSSNSVVRGGGGNADAEIARHHQFVNNMFGVPLIEHTYGGIPNGMDMHNQMMQRMFGAFPNNGFVRMPY